MVKLSIIGKFLSKYSAVLVLSIILGWTTIAYAATNTAAITVSPDTKIKNGQSLTVTGTGFTAGNETGLSECNSVNNEPYQEVYGNPVPIGCSNPLAGLFKTDNSGGFSHSYSAVAGVVGPPSPSSTTDLDGSGNPKADAAKYPCPPTGQQMLTGDICNINAGDLAGDTNSSGQTPYYNIYFYTPPITAPSGLGYTILNSSQVRLAWTAATDGIGSDFSTCNVSTLVGCKGGSRYYLVYKNGAKIAKISPATEDATALIYNSATLTGNSSFYVKAEDYGNNISAASRSTTFYPFIKITGKVTTASGTALKGVKITDSASGHTYSATTASNGTFSFAKLPAAKNSFVFKLTGYKNASYAVILGTSSSKAINVKLAKS